MILQINASQSFFSPSHKLKWCGFITSMELFQPVLLMCYRYEPPYQLGICLYGIPSRWPYLVLKFIVYCGDEDNNGDGDDNVAKAAAAVVLTKQWYSSPSLFVLHTSVLHVCPSTWNNLAPNERVFMKFDIWVYFENLEKIHHHHYHKHQGLDQFVPLRLRSYNCSRQRFFGLPIALLPCGL